jgi:hypothetical protein
VRAFAIAEIVDAQDAADAGSRYGGVPALSNMLGAARPTTVLDGEYVAASASASLARPNAPFATTRETQPPWRES